MPLKAPSHFPVSYLNKIALCIMFLVFPVLAGLLPFGSGWAGRLYAQNIGINNAGVPGNTSAMLDVDATNKGLLMPRVSLTGTADVTTIPSPAVSLLVYNKVAAGTSPDNVVPGYYYWNGIKWIALSSQAKSSVAFSTGTILQGAAVVSAAPVLMGFGNHTVENINGNGESTMPPEAGGFSFTVPFSGTIQNLQVSADLLVASNVFINVSGLQYDFTVFISPSIQNYGIDHLSSPYVTTPLTASVHFGAPFNFVIPGTFHSATNINTGTITVNAGDRIGIRIRTLQSTDPSASDITQLSFNASLSYSPVQ